MTRTDPLHPWWILLAALLLWLLATSVASAAGWGADEGVRYRTYRSGSAPAAPAPSPGVTGLQPWVRLGVAEGVDVWLTPWLLSTPGFLPFTPVAPFPRGTPSPPPSGEAP